MPAAQTVLAKAYLVSNTSNPLGKALPRVVGLGRNLVGAAGLKMHGACLSHTHDGLCHTHTHDCLCDTDTHDGLCLTMVCVSRWFVSHTLSHLTRDGPRDGFRV